MMKDILMPRFDPEMKTGRVVEWLKREGERVEKDDPVVRIDTEKVSIDVESPVSGVLSKILVNPPAEVPVGTPLGSISIEGEAVTQEYLPSKVSVGEQVITPTTLTPQPKVAGGAVITAVSTQVPQTR